MDREQFGRRSNNFGYRLKSPKDWKEVTENLISAAYLVTPLAFNKKCFWCKKECEDALRKMLAAWQLQSSNKTRENIQNMQEAKTETHRIFRRIWRAYLKAQIVG